MKFGTLIYLALGLIDIYLEKKPYPQATKLPHLLKPIFLREIVYQSY
jgi:hypothetical protein